MWTGTKTTDLKNGANQDKEQQRALLEREIRSLKKVLIIADLSIHNPRIIGLVKYLQRFRWEPIIITPPMGEKLDSLSSSIKVIETNGYRKKDVRLYARDHFEPRKFYRKVKPFLKFFYKRYSEITHYPEREKDWIPFALKFSNETLQTENVDVILSSSSPVTTHIIAKELKEKCNIPWIADFRDLWTQNLNYPHSTFRKFFERRLEMKTLAAASALITISSPMAHKLTMLHIEKQVYTIPNGFDPEKMSEEKVDLTSKFTITYTGQIYEKQNIEKLLVALKDLISEGTMDRKDVEVRIFGPKNERLEKHAGKCGLADVVMQYGMVHWGVSLQKQRESQVLWQITWEDPQEKGAYSGKIFEYLGVHRPILATGGFGGDVVEELIEDTNSGYYCPTIEDAKRALKKLYSEYKLKGAVSYHGDLGKINKYSYPEMARKFADVLEEYKNVPK